MTESKKAVFLSYASEDAAAAERICGSLRAAGIEVWFDQSELRGGDAWDRQIKSHIRDCGLFIAVISTHTNARTEGYFRREWRLAVERTHDMADDAPFLIPVTIHGTIDATTRVPDKFREVHWTHLPSGDVPVTFVGRVARLLSPNEREAAMPPSPSGRDTSAHAHTAASAGGPIPEKSIAVMPFLDMSARKDQEHFSDGLAEALIDLLTQMRDLRVAARTSSFFFKGKSEEIATIAQKLRVAHILEGSVRKSGNTIRVTAHLIRAENGYHLWSKTFDRDLEDIFKVQDEIAGVVVEALKARLLPPQGVVNRHRTISTPAYEQYLLGAHFFNFNTVEGYLRAVGATQQAIALDPEYASAFAMLASVKASLAQMGVEPVQSMAEAIAAADRAVALAPELAEAYSARGFARMFKWDWIGAQADHEQAMRLDSNGGTGQRRYGLLLAALGRFPEAVAACQRAVELEPHDTPNWIILGWCLHAAGQYVTAREALLRSLESSPESIAARIVLADIEFREGRIEEAMRISDQVQLEYVRLTVTAACEHELGRPKESQQALAKLLADHGGHAAFQISLVYARRREADEAFEWLERAYRQHDSGLWAVKMFHFGHLCSDRRYTALLRKMGLPE